MAKSGLKHSITQPQTYSFLMTKHFAIQIENPLESISLTDGGPAVLPVHLLYLVLLYMLYALEGG